MRLMVAVAVSVCLAAGSAWAQEITRPVGVHGNIYYSYSAFFILGAIVVYLVFKGMQTR